MKKRILISLVAALAVFSGFGQNVVNADRLEKIKKNYLDYPNGKAAYDALIERADKALDIRLVPVTEKNIFAVSGDPHDYVSMGPYWWADPDKPDGLPYIQRDGERNPESYQYDRTKINVLYETVRPLAFAYFFTGKEEYARRAVENLRIWFLDPETRMNPNLNYAQMIPGHNGSKGRAAGVIDAYSFIGVTEAVRLLEPSQALTPEILGGLKTWFSDLTDWLLSSSIGFAEQNATNNHSIAYDVQVVTYALFAGRDIVAKGFIDQFPERRLFAQIRPDGSMPRELQRTMSVHYTHYNLEHMLDMCMLAQRMGIELYDQTGSEGQSIPKAMEFALQWVGTPQSEYPYSEIGSWDGNQQKLVWLARRSTLLCPDQAYDALFDRYCTAGPDDLRWLLLGKKQ